MTHEAPSGFRQLKLREEQLKIPEGNFWIGSDLRVSHDVTLRPHTSTVVKIHVSPDNFPDDPRMLRQTKMSGRSILMQLGIEVGSETPEILDWTLQGQGSGDMHAAIPLTNVGNRITRIPAGMGVGALYLWNGNTFHNGQLKERVANGDIRMTGEEDKDWKYYYDRLGLVSGIQYKIDPKFRKFIPEGEPVDLSDFKNRHDRNKIDKLLEDAPVSLEPIDWITQTKSRIGLSRSVNAIIEPSLDPNDLLDPNRKFFDAQHRNSLLLKGGDEWPIRLELVSPTDEDGRPHWVLFRFAQAA